MTYRFYVDRDVNCVFVEHFDIFELSEIKQQFDTMFDDPEFRPGMNMLRDIRTVDLPEEWTLDRMLSTTRALVAEVHPRLGASRVAWLVTSQRDFGRLNQVRIILENDWQDVVRRPFYELAEALTWLEISEDYQIRPR